MISLDRCGGSFNTNDDLSDSLFVLNKKSKDLKKINMISRKNELNTYLILM